MAETNTGRMIEINKRRGTGKYVSDGEIKGECQRKIKSERHGERANEGPKRREERDRVC